jgi:peptidoglycan/xylan/chitin deacetylase (PgdA/CDA1 family)
MRRDTRKWSRWSLKLALTSAISHARSLYLSAAAAQAQRRPLILGYHRVVEDFAAAARTGNPSMLTSRAMFESHVDWLARHFRFVSLDEIGEHVAAGEPFAEPVAAMTFDDGYRDVYENALPILTRKGIPAAVFVVTDLAGGLEWQYHDKLYHLMDRGFATWDDPRRELMGLLTDLNISAELLRAPRATKSALLTISALLPALAQTDIDRVIDVLEAAIGNGSGEIPLTLTWPMIAHMRRAGFTIGSHTKTHASLPAESSEKIAEELEGSKRELETRLGEPIAHFAYPGGHFTPSVVEALARAGYRFAYTACPHRDPRHPSLTIERLLLWEGSSIDADGRFAPTVLNCQAHDLWPPARTCARTHHV